eukprot:TRINITY_DN12232_c0_g1_i4.p1 TRINITY_DN12232_c0_g1~~TRINITY_DN12232_c0_g1_i4.p1  ORF type:complete len:146 (-),score=19.24 TRINITY_DN12232_c0_g1_i4:51-488(-)
MSILMNYFFTILMTCKVYDTGSTISSTSSGYGSYRTDSQDTRTVTIEPRQDLTHLNPYHTLNVHEKKRPSCIKDNNRHLWSDRILPSSMTYDNSDRYRSSLRSSSSLSEPSVGRLSRRDQVNMLRSGQDIDSMYTEGCNAQQNSV